MKRVIPVFSALALAGTIIPSLGFLFGNLALEEVKLWMLVSTAVWFVSVPFWMGREASEDGRG